MATDLALPCKGHHKYDGNI